MILGSLRRLFHRYADRHLVVAIPAGTLRGPGGETLGHLDKACRIGSRLHLEGWARCDRVTLISGGMQSSTVPEQRRDDVAAATGGPAEVGFTLDLALQDEPPRMFLSVAGQEVAQDLPAPGPADLRRAIRRLRWRFLWQLILCLPDILCWRLRADPACRARIKRRLDLDPQRQAGPLEPRIFLASAAGAQEEENGDTPVTIVLPVYNAFHLLPEVLDRVERHSRLDWHLVVIEDCSTDAAVRPFLQDWAAARPDRVSLLENAQNLGFIGSVNRGLAAARARGTHVLLLNSDALVPEGWDARLLRPMLAQDSVASVTPMSNDAEIFSVPAICRRAVLRPGEAEAIDAAARRIDPEAGLAVAPTGVGFCMAMNATFLARVPGFDPVFGRGYGEEVDWCQKTRALGGQHLGLPALFVEHRGGESFGSADKLKLVQANNAIVARRYQGYDAEVQDFIRADPLLTPRLALGLAWAGARAGAAGLPIYLAHSLGGGAEHDLEARIAADIERVGAAVVLRVGGLYRWRVELHGPEGVTAGMVTGFGVVQDLLAPVAARRIIYSCGVGDPDPVALPGCLLALKRGDQDRIEVLVHDFFPVSPSYCLLDGDGVYRGPVTASRADPAHASRRPDGRRTSLAEWQAAWGGLLAAAERITVFSRSSREILLATYPAVEPVIEVCPHKTPALPRCAAGTAAGRPPRVVGVLGNIGQQKGAALLAPLGQALAADGRRLVVVGNVDPSYELPASVTVHGSYRPGEIPALAAHYGIDLWLIPSIWPETFSFTTHEALATGLPVMAFALGAQGAAVDRAEHGLAVPLAEGQDPAGALVEALKHPLPTEKVKER